MLVHTENRFQTLEAWVGPQAGGASDFQTFRVGTQGGRYVLLHERMLYEHETTDNFIYEV